MAGQLGLEPTFNEYLDKLMAVFDEVKRVLKSSGTVWVNLGDTYGGHRGEMRSPGSETYAKEAMGYLGKNFTLPGTRTKCLVAIPDRFKIAMIDRGGWICRNELIWYKRNCMPSSAKDRFTVDYEKIFFFCKSERYYFETQYEPYSEATLSDLRVGKVARGELLKLGESKYDGSEVHGGNKRHPSIYKSIANNEIGRLKRCVWDITTHGFKEAHFATFPEELVQNCIKPGCPVGGLVCDPFFGSGTVGLVALKMARNFLGIELNPSYIEMANKRLAPLIAQTRFPIS